MSKWISAFAGAALTVSSFGAAPAFAGWGGGGGMPQMNLANLSGLSTSEVNTGAAGNPYYPHPQTADATAGNSGYSQVVRGGTNPFQSNTVSGSQGNNSWSHSGVLGPNTIATGTAGGVNALTFGTPSWMMK